MAAKEVIRAARAEECALLSELAMRSKAHWGYDAAFMEACRDELTVRPEDIEARRVTVLERDGKVLGFYGIDGEAPGGELWWLFVEPSAIGSGAGRTLWNHAVDSAAGLGMKTLRIESDPGAEGFYLAVGAVRVGETPSLSIPGRALPLFEYSVFREMTEYERAVLDRLLSVDFPGIEAARAQASSARVRTLDDCGCLEFEAVDGPHFQYTEHVRILAEGDGPSDSSGVPITIMLRAERGRLLWLEFHRFSGDPNYQPAPEEWAITAVAFTELPPES